MAVYLLHFQLKDGSSDHYIGHTDRDPTVRFAEHLSGHGAVRTGRLIRSGAVAELAYVWPTANLRFEYYLTELALRAPGYAGEDFCPYCLGHELAVPTLDDVVQLKKKFGLAPMPKNWGGKQRGR